MPLLMTLTLYVFHLRSDFEGQMQIDEIIQSFSTSWYLFINVSSRTNLLFESIHGSRTGLVENACPKRNTDVIKYERKNPSASVF